jgi:hypothetical protein
MQHTVACTQRAMYAACVCYVTICAESRWDLEPVVCSESESKSVDAFLWCFHVQAWPWSAAGWFLSLLSLRLSLGLIFESDFDHKSGSDSDSDTESDLSLSPNLSLNPNHELVLHLLNASLFVEWFLIGGLWNVVVCPNKIWFVE